MRTQDLLSDGAVSIIAKAIEALARTSSEVAELDVIARQMDSAMFFAMNEFGPLSDGRRRWPPVSCERGLTQQ